MSKREKLIRALLSGNSDANIAFSELVGLLESLGFRERIKGSHHIFTKEGVRERINLQNDGKLAKSYQVRQIRNVLTSNQLLKDE